MFYNILGIRNASPFTIFITRVIFVLFVFGVFLILFNYTVNPVPVTSIIWALSPDSFNDFRESTQEDPKMIYYIKNYLIQPPSPKPYNLTKNQKWVIDQQSFMANFCKNKENGTYIEVGAYDGELGSVTLNQEIKKGWTGLLIEPNPISYEKLISRNRKVNTIQCCLSDTRSQKMVLFRLSDQQSEVIKNNKTKANDTSVKLTWCYPLYSLMVATNLTNLDLLSLDLQGFEIKVLKTLPWEKVNIKAILIEYHLVPEGKKYVMDYMLKKNYTFVKDFGWDFFFVKNKTA